MSSSWVEWALARDRSPGRPAGRAEGIESARGAHPLAVGSGRFCLRVVRQDEETMVVREVPAVQYLFAAVFVVAGFAFGGLGFGDSGARLLVPTAIAVGLGALIVWLSPVTTSTFNHRRGAYEVRRSGLFRSTVASGALAHISDVRVEEASTETTYRVVLVLRSGARVPLSAWWSNSRRRSNQVAARLAAFLGGMDDPRTT